MSKSKKNAERISIQPKVLLVTQEKLKINAYHLHLTLGEYIDYLVSLDTKK